MFKRLFAIVMVVMIVVPLCVNSSAAALSADGNVQGLSPAQAKLFKNKIYYFDAEVGALTCGGATLSTLSGSENEEKIFNYLTKTQNLTAVQAAGIMGNLSAESGFNPRRVQNTKTPEGDRDDMVIGKDIGFGIAQWTSIDRQRKLHDAVIAAKTKDSDLRVQLDYLWTELNTVYKSDTLEPLRATNDVAQATVIVVINFERPAEKNSPALQRERINNAQGVLTKYGSSTASTSSVSDAVTVVDPCAASTEGAGGALVQGEFSLPVAKKWYEQHPEWFTKPHHRHANGSEDIASDIPVPLGTPVYSMTGGKIIKAPNEGGYGEGVTIDAGGGIIINYGHGSDGGSVSAAHKGDTVKPGQLILHSASTGFSTGPHLHVDISLRGIKRCPQTLFVGIVENKIPAIASLPTSGCSEGGL